MLQFAHGKTCGIHVKKDSIVHTVRTAHHVDPNIDTARIPNNMTTKDEYRLLNGLVGPCSAPMGAYLWPSMANTRRKISVMDASLSLAVLAGNAE